MPCNPARSLPRNLLAWCCYIALRVVWAHEALQGSPEGLDLAPAIHSSHDDLVAPYNDDHRFNHGELVNHKRLRESQQAPHQSDPQRPKYLDLNHEPLDIKPEIGIRSTHVAKRPMTAKDGYFATPIPQSLNHGSDTSSPYGATTNDGSGPSGLKDHPAGNQFNQLQSSLVPSTSSASLHPNVLNSKPMPPFMPPEAQKSCDDLINNNQGLETGRSSTAHSTGASSEKTDENHRSMHSSTEWDPELAALDMPDVNMDDHLLQKIHNDFNHHIHGKLEVQLWNLVHLPHDHLNHLPVAFFKESKSPLLMIRVVCAPEYQYHNSKSLLASQNSPQKILNQFYCLINWLLFINTAVLRRLHAQGLMSEKSDEEESNRRLMVWFFGETFEPLNSWPVVGTITRKAAHAPGKTFGPIQKILITCLSSPLHLKRELQTAVLLVSHYYKYQFPTILEALGSGQLVDFKSLINNAIESKMIVGNGFKNGKWIENIGNFPVHSLQRIPKELQQSTFRSILFLKRYGVKPGTEEELLRKYIQEIILQSQEYTTMEPRQVKFHHQEYPVLISIGGQDATGLKHGTVWPIHHKTDNLFLKRHLIHRINRFLDHLNVCFSQLMECKEGKQIKLGDVNGMEWLLFGWLRKILFNPGQDKFPLLGPFILKEGRQEESFSAQDFNEIQALVLNLIADQNFDMRNFQTALSVLGYWLKNEQGVLYNQLFKNDDEYWDNLTQLIKSEIDSKMRISQRKW